MRSLFFIVLRGLLYLVLFLLLLIVLYRFLPVLTTITMLSDDNEVRRSWVPIEEISPNMVRAVIAAEDSNFCNHNGFDKEAIKKAIEDNRRGGRF